jgi:hypothetical protein
MSHFKQNMVDLEVEGRKNDCFRLQRKDSYTTHLLISADMARCHLTKKQRVHGACLPDSHISVVYLLSYSFEAHLSLECETDADYT